MGRFRFITGLLLGLIASFSFGVRIVGSMDAQCKQEKAVQLDDSLRRMLEATERANADKQLLIDRIARLDEEIAKLEKQVAWQHSLLHAVRQTAQQNETKRDVWSHAEIWTTD